jgi:hypothetical protein
MCASISVFAEEIAFTIWLVTSSKLSWCPNSFGTPRVSVVDRGSGDRKMVILEE